jgi:hypothetical protein
MTILLTAACADRPVDTASGPSGASVKQTQDQAQPQDQPKPGTPNTPNAPNTPAARDAAPPTCVADKLETTGLCSSDVVNEQAAQACAARGLHLVDLTTSAPLAEAPVGVGIEKNPPPPSCTTIYTCCDGSVPAEATAPVPPKEEVAPTAPSPGCAPGECAPPATTCARAGGEPCDG